jgi:hypothetical protein
MGAYKSTPVPSVEKVDRSHRSRKSATLSSTTSSMGNWSGVENTPSYITNYTSVEGSFVQPTKKDGVSNTYECSWVGLGGDMTNYSTPQLIQCGTVMEPNSYHIWWEKVNASYDTGEQDLSSITVKPGNHITLRTSYEALTSTAYFYMANTTTGQAQLVSTSASGYYAGNTAEFIDERPEMTSALGTTCSNLANYGTISWTNCVSTLSGSGSTAYQYDAENLPFVYITMKSGSTILSQPSSFTSSTSFVNHFYKSYS